MLTTKINELLSEITEETSISSIKKLDKLLKGFNKFSTNPYDKTAFAWIKDGKIVSTMHYPKASINLSIGKFTGNIEDMKNDDKGMDWYIKNNTKDKKVLKEFDKSDTYGDMDKYEFVKKLLKEI